MSMDYWWPRGNTCVDYADQQCRGTIDYNACFNNEYMNCPYI